MSDRRFDSPTSDLKGRATRGAMITGVAQATKVAIQLSSVVFLSRLLSPADFGVLGMVAPIYGFAMMFQDFGLTQATIQKADISHRQLSALFWINFGVSVSIGLVLMALSPLVVLFYGDPRVGPVVIAFGAIMMVAGLGSQHMALLNRHMRFGALSAIDCIGAASGLAVSILVGMALHSYWALVAGSLAIAVAPTAISWALTRWTPGPPRRTEDMREILGFGAGITGFNFANFFARNLDNILIGRRWGDDALGLYDRAYKLLLFPLQQVTGPLSRVMLPVLSRLTSEPDRYRRAYLNTLGQMLLIVTPGVAWMVACATLLVTTLLGKEWHGAAPIFGALGFAALIQPLNSSSGWLYISQGRSREYMQWGIASTLVAVVSFFVGLPWGPVGVAVAYAANEFLKTPAIWWAVTRNGPVSFKHVLTTAAPFALGTAGALGATKVVEQQLAIGGLLELAVCLCVAYPVAWSLVALTPSGRATLKESILLVEGLVRKVRPKAA